MTYAYGGPEWVAITRAFTIGDLQYPANWPELATPEELEEAGVAVIVDPTIDPPEGQAFTGWQTDEAGEPVLADVTGVPMRIATYAAPPLPSEVPMYKVRKWLILNDLKTAVVDHLDGLPEPNRSLAIEDFEYAPNLVVNSPLALGCKAALGMTDEQYEQAIRAVVALP